MYLQRIHFLLIKRPVHHLVGDVRIQQCDDVQCLHHIRTVGASKRYIRLQADVALQRPDAATNCFVRQIFPLSIGIQHGKQEGSELVSAGDAAELDAGFHIVFQQCELQHGVLYLTHPAGELVGTACHILQESDKLLCLLVTRMIGDVKDVAGFQMLEYAPHLV